MYWIKQLLFFPLALFTFNMGEWFIHKYLLHEAAKRKWFWQSHWYQHHRDARRNGMFDLSYNETPFKMDSYGQEILGLLLIGLAFTPLILSAPGFVLGIWFSCWYFHYAHKRSHLDIEWAYKWLPHHVDHHLGPNQNLNWGVSWPWCDWVMRTRQKYVGTEKHRQDLERRKQKKQRAGVDAPRST